MGVGLILFYEVIFSEYFGGGYDVKEFWIIGSFGYLLFG